MSEMYLWLLSFTPEGTQTSGDLPATVIATHSIRESRFWGWLTFLPSTDPSPVQPHLGGLGIAERQIYSHQ